MENFKVKEYVCSLCGAVYHNLDEYLKYKAKYTDKSYSDVIAIINVKANLDWYSNTIETDISKTNLMLVNKFHYLMEISRVKVKKTISFCARD